MFLNIFASGIVHYAFDYESTTQFGVKAEYVVWGAWYTLLAIQILWIGFYLLPDKPHRWIARLSLKSVPLQVTHVFFSIYILSVMVGISTGTFGYTADQEGTAFESYIRYGLNAGLIAIILTTIYHYDSLSGRTYLYAIIAMNVTTGILFGHKSTVVMPVMMFMFTTYICGRKISVTSILVFVGALGVAFSLVEPFRLYYEAVGRGSDTRSLSGLLSMFAESQEYSGAETDYADQFIRRMSYVTVLGKVIEYADISNYYHSEEWGHLILSPLYGAIPRLIWESKPLADFGAWASVNIFNLPQTTSIGITPQGYSYLVMRLPGIIVFFTLYGLIQRIGFNMLYFRTGLLPFYIYFCLFVLFPSFPTWTAVSTFVQSTIVIVFIMLLARIIGHKSAQRVDPQRTTYQTRTAVQGTRTTTPRRGFT